MDFCDIIFADYFEYFRFGWDEFCTLRRVNVATSKIAHTVRKISGGNIICYRSAKLVAVWTPTNIIAVNYLAGGLTDYGYMYYTGLYDYVKYGEHISFIKLSQTKPHVVNTRKIRILLNAADIKYTILRASRICGKYSRTITKHSVSMVDDDYDHVEKYPMELDLSDLERYGYIICPTARLFTNCRYPVILISKQRIRCGRILLYNAEDHEPLAFMYLYGLVMYTSTSSPAEITHGNEILAAKLLLVTVDCDADT